MTAADAVDAEDTDRILDRVQALPELTRRVVTLRKVYGQSQQQIADALDISAAEVMTRLTESVRACADVGEMTEDSERKARCLS